MATTTNYSWLTPDDTGLVKNGASDIRTLGSAIDTTTKALNPSTTLGDIEYRSSTANTNTRLGIGSTGQVLTVAGGVPTWANAASGATTFTQRLAATGVYFTAFATNGSNIYVGVGNTGQLYSSPDGLTWTSRTSGFGTNLIYDVAFGNGLFVAVGVNGTITTSTDGTTWTARTANMGANTIRAVTYANSLWVAVGAGGGATNTGGITYSTDGTTWTRKSQTLTIGTTYNCVVWNGTNWIVGADLSTNNYLYASTPSGTWTAGSTAGANISQIYWDGTRHITCENTSLRYSTSTTLGTTTAYNDITFQSDSGKQYTSYYSSKIYIGQAYITTITPTSTANPTINGASIVSPIGYQTTSTPFINWGTNTPVIFACAAGLIVSDYRGRIWTTF